MSNATFPFGLPRDDPFQFHTQEITMTDTQLSDPTAKAVWQNSAAPGARVTIQRTTAGDFQLIVQEAGGQAAVARLPEMEFHQLIADVGRLRVPRAVPEGTIYDTIPRAQAGADKALIDQQHDTTATSDVADAGFRKQARRADFTGDADQHLPEPTKPKGYIGEPTPAPADWVEPEPIEPACHPSDAIEIDAAVEVPEAEVAEKPYSPQGDPWPGAKG